MTEFLITYKSTFVILHALAAAGGLGAVIVTDTLFFKFLKDSKISRTEDSVLQAISGLVWVIIAVIFITGAALFFGAPMDYLAKSKFVTKMVIFSFIVINGVTLHFVVSPYLRKISFGAIAPKSPLKLRVIRRIAFASGAISIISWFVVFILGSLRSIPVTTGQALIAYGGLIAIGILGSQMYAAYLKNK